MANEKRLVDAWDLIEWLDDFDRENNLRVLRCKKARLLGSHAVRNMIVNAPTVDAVEVVRCGECIHRRYVDMGDEIGAIGGCGLFGTPMMTCNDFCSYGERRTDGN